MPHNRRDNANQQKEIGAGSTISAHRHTPYWIILIGKCECHLKWNSLRRGIFAIFVRELLSPGQIDRLWIINAHSVLVHICLLLWCLIVFRYCWLLIGFMDCAPWLITAREAAIKVAALGDKRRLTLHFNLFCLCLAISLIYCSPP